jgi:hypothetical protein
VDKFWIGQQGWLMEAAIVTNLYLGLKLFNVVSVDQLVHSQNSSHVGPIVLQLQKWKHVDDWLGIH